MLSHDEIMAQRAVPSDGEALPEARTGEDLLAAGLDVRFFGADDAEGSSGAASDADMEVEEDVFCRWLERAEFVLGGRVARWWVHLGPGKVSCGGAPWKDDAEVVRILCNAKAAIAVLQQQLQRQLQPKQARRKRR